MYNNNIINHINYDIKNEIDNNLNIILNYSKYIKKFFVDIKILSDFYVNDIHNIIIDAKSFYLVYKGIKNNKYKKIFNHIYNYICNSVKLILPIINDINSYNINKNIIMNTYNNNYNLILFIDNISYNNNNFIIKLKKFLDKFIYISWYEIFTKIKIFNTYLKKISFIDNIIIYQCDKLISIENDINFINNKLI